MELCGWSASILRLLHSRCKYVLHAKRQTKPAYDDAIRNIAKYRAPVLRVPIAMAAPMQPNTRGMTMWRYRSCVLSE